MEYLFSFFLKLSLSLAVVYLFYQFVLRRLTFYTWNRWYLLGYSAIAFFIPFIDITPLLQWGQWKLLNAVPTVADYTYRAPVAAAKGWSRQTIVVGIILAGVAVLGIKLLLQYLSFRKLRSQAVLLEDGAVKLYQVNEAIMPFAFGNAVFINRAQHSETELQEIIKHEYVHIRQRHTLDMAWGEILCALNWFNPFAWLIRAAIRQNLEFIADRAVLQGGIERKQYQYLLLKVMGQPTFRIANNFNFSSLKKRIAMMNKQQSARTHLVRFLFILPLLVVVLAAFRSLDQNPRSAYNVTRYTISMDTVPVMERVIVKDNRVLKPDTAIEPQKEDIAYRIYVVQDDRRYVDTVHTVERVRVLDNRIDTVPVVIERYYDHPINIQRDNVHATVTRDGVKEEYDLTNPKEKAAFEKKYGKLPPPPPAPPASVAPKARPTPPTTPAPPVPADSSKPAVPPAPPAPPAPRVVVTA